MKIALPAQNVSIQVKTGEIDPTWFEKLKEIVGAINSGAIGQGSLSTTATTGFGFFPTCAGPPTGVPVAQAGFVPCVFDTVNNKLWIYHGTWKGAVFI